MMDDIGDVANYYDNDALSEDRRLEEHQLEYDLTWRYFRRYMPAGGKILELGAATGRYTLELARRGYHLTAVDISPVELEVCRRRLSEHGLAGRARILAADARDLSLVKDRDFDACLAMGPLYHLVVESDRRLVLRNAFERLKEGGLIFSAWISRFGVFGELLKKVPEWIEDSESVESLLARGCRPDDRPPGGFRGYFARVGEIAPLHEEVGFATILLAAVEPGISADDESYNRLDRRLRERWLDLLERVSTEETILGASRHLLYIGRKPPREMND
jgi:SAM-dependent methyltransferase